MGTSMAEKILLVDGNNIMHRSYHALPATMRNADGVPTNAISGFLQTLLRALELEKPAYAAVAFDLHGPTFRHEQYPDYKAKRPPTPDDLVLQFDWVKRLLESMHVAILTVPGYEADDILGTVSRYCNDLGMEAVLLTGDKDAFQLIGNGTYLMYPSGKGDTERADEAYLQNRYSLTSDRMTDLKGLMGDPSDNIPGVPGVGEKTALKLLSKYGTLENVLDGAEAGEKGALRERLMANREQAIFSKQLATISRDAPMELNLENWKLKNPAEDRRVLEYLEQRRALAKIRELFPPQEAQAEEDALPPSDALGDLAQAAAWAKAHAKAGGTAAFSAEEKGMASVCDDTGAGAALPLGSDLLSIEPKDAYAALLPFLENRETLIVHDSKALWGMGISLPESAFDVMLAAYCIDPQGKSFDIASLAEGIPGDTDARKLLGAAQTLMPRIEKDDLGEILYEIEAPLARVLSQMEQAGFAVDREELVRLGGIYAERIEELLEAVRAVDAEVNVNSPKQLGTLLFEKLGLPATKKTSRGYSTDEDTLLSLIEKDKTGVVEAILEYRKYAKLKSTYIDGLLKQVGSDGRIHTSFDQTKTATGRISSKEPNLQNIPVRTELGRDIRRAFMAGEGCLLVDADYSQIELRVLSHMSGDPVMTDAFLKGQDIHARTAAEVYGVPIESVTKEMRSAAKAVNFGIVYGISDFGLAKNIGVSRKEAAGFIARYFERYPGIKGYMDKMVEEGKKNGYATTLFGRRRYLPELKSPNYAVRQFGERCAMNSPIQGTAADIIKRAMIRTARALEDKGLSARLILQVHDELIVEAPVAEVETVKAILKEAMESVAELKAPLKADLSVGKCWADCK